MIKDLRKKSFSIFKNNISSNATLGILCGLLCAAILSISLLNSALVLLLVPFLMLPLIFACYCAYIQLQHNISITGKGFFNNFLNYYRSSFISSFSVIKSFLISLLVDIVATLIFMGIAYLSIKYTNGTRFNELIDQITILLKSQYTYEQLTSLLNSYSDVVIPFECITIIPSSFLSFITFIYFSSKSSLSVYYRLSIPNVNGAIAGQVEKRVERLNKRQVIKEYLGLNYPLFILLTLGFGTGIGVAYGVNTTVNQAVSFGFIFAFVFASFYFPLYFPNMQVIFEHHMKDYQDMTLEVTKDLINRFNQNINLTSQQKEDLEKIFNDINKEENKKDDVENDETNSDDKDKKE